MGDHGGKRRGAGRPAKEYPPPAPGEVKARKCLTCAKEFKSLHIGNRICDRCKKGEIFRGANFLSIFGN